MVLNNYHPKILLVDQTDRELTVLSYYLSKRGVTVFQSNSIHEARQYRNCYNFDAVILRLHDDQFEVRSFLSSLSDLPSILVLGEESAKLKAKYSKFTPYFIQESNAENELPAMTFQAIEDFLGHLQQAA